MRTWSWPWIRAKEESICFSALSPRTWRRKRNSSPEVRPLWNLKERRSQTICCISEHCVPPPRLHRVNSNIPIIGILQNEEDQHSRDCHTRIERSRQDIVVFSPPGEVSATDNVLEDEPNKTPRDIVDRGGGRNRAGSAENDREARGLEGET